jgi:mRNA-degrading endonuclease RelE of RelBE toxin-antitoxin system
MYKVIIKPLAEREFRKLSKELQKKFYEGFRKLSIDPFALPNLKRIKGTKFGWRFRVGRWRILFSLFDKEKRIEIVDIFLKKGKEDYRKKMKLLK